MGEIFVAVCVAGDCHPVCWCALPCVKPISAGFINVRGPRQMGTATYGSGSFFDVIYGGFELLVNDVFLLILKSDLILVQVPKS